MLEKVNHKVNELRYFLNLSHSFTSGAERVDRVLDHPLSKAKLRLVSVYMGYKNRNLFDDVQKYCMFVGYPRSGHSLIGALLDAHPNAVIAHELHALRFIEAGFSRKQLWYLLLENSRAFAANGRTWERYSYEVPHQWQGRFSTLRIIGDKKGGGTTRMLSTNPQLIQRLQQTIGTEIRYLHVVRNPYDNITTIHQNNKLSLPESIDNYFVLCKAVTHFKQLIPASHVLDVRYEEFVENPSPGLKRICHFLDLEAEDNYLADCAGIIFKSPRPSRYKIEWDSDNIERVKTWIRKFPFLKGYSYEA